LSYRRDPARRRHQHVHFRESIITHETQTRLMRSSNDGVLWLAMVATGTALCISALAGWQRGGALSERFVWVGISLVLVVSAHLLPALVRHASIVVHIVASLLWAACMATACYGHATFFLLAQRHAGELRASAVAVVPPSISTRSLTVVMAERATLVAQLATARARYCVGNCATLEARRVTLAAKLDALNAEADDVRRRQSRDDQVTAKRDALLADPVTTRLAALLGTTTSRVDLLSGLAFAAVLEGVACLLWTLALQHPPRAAAEPDVTQASHAPSTISSKTAIASRALPNAPLVAGPTEVDVTQLIKDIAAGRVRATVADIRRHLGCSQAKAVALRRQLAERRLTA
jgi:hypothetical protein